MFIEVEQVSERGVRSCIEIDAKDITSQKLVIRTTIYPDKSFTQHLTRITFKDGKTMLVTNSPAEIIKHRIPYL